MNVIQQPVLVAFILIALTSILWKLSRHPVAGKMFKLFPVPFWCYMIPMGFTTFGWLPETSPVYTFFSQHILPAAIVLLLIGTDLKALRNTGPLAILVMLSGSLGTIIGGLAGFLMFKQWLPQDAWALVGALTGSWIGGSMNLLAVKEALQIPDASIAPVIIADAVIAYSWMALLISGSNFQTLWNKLIGQTDSNKTNESVILKPTLYEGCFAEAEESMVRDPSPCLPAGRQAQDDKTLLKIVILFASVCLSLFAQRVARQLPSGDIMNPAVWTILMVTTAALLVSLTPLSKIENAQISQIGTFALYLLLASIGARANFRAAAQAPIFFAFGLTWILIHGACLLLAGCWLKAPLKLIATASQANIGGPISAPIVGATYHPHMAGAGLLMAILGNVLGTYLGLLTAVLARHL